MILKSDWKWLPRNQQRILKEIAQWLKDACVPSTVSSASSFHPYEDFKFKNPNDIFALIDWLDNSNNKKALQEADKVLKKQPDFVCCKALKALALVRLGREEEASPILDSILQRGTCDEGALQAMNVALREMQQRKFLLNISKFRFFEIRILKFVVKRFSSNWSEIWTA